MAARSNNSAFTAFREAGRNCIRLYADLNGDGLVTGSDENVVLLLADDPDDRRAAPRDGRGTVGGQADSGQAWVTAAAGAEELARDIVPNPGGTDMFQYFTGPDDATAPNAQLTPPALSTTTCASLSDVNRARVRRVKITVTGRAVIGGVACDQDDYVRCAWAQRSLREETRDV